MSAVDYLVALKSQLIPNGISNSHKPIPIVNGTTIKNGVECNKTTNGVECITVNGMTNGTTDNKVVNGIKSKLNQFTHFLELRSSL